MLTVTKHNYTVFVFVCACVYFRLLAQLDETDNAFEQFWCKHHLRLEQCLQLRHFEQDFREVRNVSTHIYKYMCVCIFEQLNSNSAIERSKGGLCLSLSPCPHLCPLCLSVHSRSKCHWTVCQTTLPACQSSGILWPVSSIF